MQTGNVTTPFGRRQVTLALIKRQNGHTSIQHDKAADKWRVLRDISAAMSKLGLQSNSIAVLDALLSFLPGNELRQGANLVVFPSNSQLCLRAHGMAGATLRRHVAMLVEAGIVVRRDSANGKRYARRSRTGEIEQAFGFDLSPLLSRSDEFAMMAQDVIAERMALKSARENLTICRRDLRKLITAAREERIAGDWSAIEETYLALVSRMPRVATLPIVQSLLVEMQQLREIVVNLLVSPDNSSDASTSDAHIEQHIQNSNTKYLSESEPGFGKGLKSSAEGEVETTAVPLKSFPLSLVLKACPQIGDYGDGGKVGCWRDLMSAASVVRTFLGITPSVYQDACAIMGPENAATAIACVLERAPMISSPGAYLRDLTRRTYRGEFSVGPMLMALLNSKQQSRTHTL